MEAVMCITSLGKYTPTVQRLLKRSRDIWAKGIAFQHVAGVGISARTRAATNLTIFTFAAFPPEPAGIVERAEQFRITIDIWNFGGPHVACRHRQEACGADVSGVGDEHDAVAVADPQAVIHRHSVQG